MGGGGGPVFPRAIEQSHLGRRPGRQKGCFLVKIFLGSWNSINYLFGNQTRKPFQMMLSQVCWCQEILDQVKYV